MLGVTLLILDDGDDLTNHKVYLELPKAPRLEFKKSGDFLFSISDKNDVYSTACYSFNHPKINKNLRLSFADKPQFVPMQEDEFAANSIFLVCAFSFGGDAKQKNVIEKLLIEVEDGKAPLLAEIFTRLITEQWKFKYIDEIARTLRSNLRPVINKYNNYAVAEIDCTRTGILENNLQEMQASQNEANFLLSSLNGAIQTLDINAYNLATRLERIRNFAAQKNWQIYFHNKGIEALVWSGDKKSNYDEPLLAIFQLHIKNLKDHNIYLQQQIDHLTGLQARWRLYLSKRRSLSGEHLNTLMSLLIVLLAGSGASYTIGKVGIDIENQVLLGTVIIIAVAPIFWYFSGRFFKLLCCIFHGTGMYDLCGRFTKIINSIRFFRWFKR